MFVRRTCRSPPGPQGHRIFSVPRSQSRQLAGPPPSSVPHLSSPYVFPSPPADKWSQELHRLGRPSSKYSRPWSISHRVAVISGSRGSSHPLAGDLLCHPAHLASHCSLPGRPGLSGTMQAGPRSVLSLFCVWFGRFSVCIRLGLRVLQIVYASRIPPRPLEP